MKTIILAGILFIILSINTNAQSGGEWHQTLNGRNVWSLTIHPPGGNTIYAGGLTGANSRIWKSTNEGLSWDTIYIGSGQTMWEIAFDANNSMYVANYSTGVLKSTNAGQTFTIIDASNFSNKNVQGIKCGPNNHVYATTSTGFFRSTNGGANWTESATMVGLNCLPLLVDKDSANIIYVGVSSGAGTGIGVYRSTDFGVTFSANLNPNKNGYNLTQTPNGNLYMVTTTAPYNFDKSTNKGLTWTTVSNTPSAMRGLTSTAVTIPAFLFTGGNNGVFISQNDGVNWSNYGAFTISTTPLAAKNNRIFAGTSGSANGGVWWAHIPLVNIEQISNSIPDKFLLKQNYPNPFNPSTSIEFKIAKSSFTSLKVYDVNGKEVSELINQNLSAGTYKIDFNAGNFSSGIYFYTLKTNNFQETKRMVLIK
ncbi:MAG TPA: T9SS type A sorting domain-containing protein [Ignavibacteria bacterium]|nr:T9SS type A sorting domain-containing protein [Ignavibacteria bacterium]